jgi:hypothetical protein
VEFKEMHNSLLLLQIGAFNGKRLRSRMAKTLVFPGVRQTRRVRDFPNEGEGISGPCSSPTDSRSWATSRVLVSLGTLYAEVCHVGHHDQPALRDAGVSDGPGHQGLGRLDRLEAEATPAIPQAVDAQEETGEASGAQELARQKISQIEQRGGREGRLCYCMGSLKKRHQRSLFGQGPTH